MARDLPTRADQLQVSAPFAAQPITAKIVALIKARAALTVGRLATDVAGTMQPAVQGRDLS